MPRPRKRLAASNALDVQEIASAKRQKTTQTRSKPFAEETKFSSSKCLGWFRKYTTDDPMQLGPEGMEKFCADINVQPEDIGMLCIAWKMNAKNMGYFTQSEWLRGLGDPEIVCDSPAKLQNKFNYLYSLLNDPQTFKSIFRYAYDFARDKDQRSMDIETAKAMLALLLSKSWPLYSEFNEFLEQPKSPRVINKDQWNNIYEFSKTISTDLSNFAIDGAWPVLLDDFVDFLQKKREKSS